MLNVLILIFESLSRAVAPALPDLGATFLAARAGPVNRPFLSQADRPDFANAKPPSPEFLVRQGFGPQGLLGVVR